MSTINSDTRAAWQDIASELSKQRPSAGMSKHTRKIRARLTGAAPVDVHTPEVAVFGLRALEEIRARYLPSGVWHVVDREREGADLSTEEAIIVAAYKLGLLEAE